MATIQFEAQLYTIGAWTILRLPERASAQLPSRGMTMVAGTINGAPFQAVLEPDGRYGPGQQSSHWFRPDKKLLDDASAQAGDTVHVALEPTKEWIEPDVPEDLRKALATSPKAEALWKDITPSARWEWIRWVRAVKTPETRQKHIAVALAKLNKGMRRPCCFNRNLCSEPSVSHNWVLLEPTQTTEKRDCQLNGSAQTYSPLRDNFGDDIAILSPLNPFVATPGGHVPPLWEETSRENGLS